MRERLERGEFFACMKKALAQDELVVINDPHTECPVCPFSRDHAGFACLTRRLVCGGRLYGILSISVPEAYARDAEEQDFFNETTHALAFALNRIEDTHALAKSENQLKTIYENAPLLIDAFDENGSCVIWNKQCRKIFGWTIDEINAHQDPLSVTYPDPAVRRQVKKAIISEPDGLFRQWHPVTKDGRTLTTMWANFRLPGGLTIGLGHDITERKRAQDELKLSKALLRDVMDLVPAFICAKNKKGRFILVNKNLADFYRSTVDKMQGKLHSAFCEDKEELHAMLAADLDVMENGIPKVIPEETMKNADGSFSVLRTEKIPFTANGEPAVLIVSRDITDLKRAREEMIHHQRAITLNNRIANVFLTAPQEEIYADVLDVIIKALSSRFGYFGYIDESGDLICASMTRGAGGQCRSTDESLVLHPTSLKGIWGQSLTEKRAIFVNEDLRLTEGNVALENALVVPIIHHDKVIGQFGMANKQGEYDEYDREMLDQ